MVAEEEEGCALFEMGFEGVEIGEVEGVLEDGWRGRFGEEGLGGFGLGFHRFGWRGFGDFDAWLSS